MRCWKCSDTGTVRWSDGGKWYEKPCDNPSCPTVERRYTGPMHNYDPDAESGYDSGKDYNVGVATDTHERNLLRRKARLTE